MLVPVHHHLSISTAPFLWLRLASAAPSCICSSASWSAFPLRMLAPFRKADRRRLQPLCRFETATSSPKGELPLCSPVFKSQLAARLGAPLSWGRRDTGGQSTARYRAVGAFRAVRYRLQCREREQQQQQQQQQQHCALFCAI
ncbi:hypothetical protein M441DRAFT_426246 [Trichoderma asperellum CBS 433.97]|uniref:Secreted protein n=1 Tax=Trichoderma asperellum (strain ATCC 204424 / CBS 433.97 / NBRC 101777) TaxID=1042311 RepID=A0A2T3Z5K6_TRIA4|nr:hypothetical protein M441DRAFT_426246 [Trichoderma asperellum CBS 433.97]PTB40077.1 hypothetical protein M441DRAFT_426246 [Trichoderma asperellum CBS 433.97]